MIRLTIPSIDEEEINAVSEVLRTGFLVQGRNVAEFEKALAEYTGAKYTIAVSNCTAALHLSLLALGIGKGDIVIVSPYSWPASANVIELCGATSVFVDIEPRTFNMNPNKLSEKLEELSGGSIAANKVKALIPVHAFGRISNMKAITDIAEKYEIPVVEDAACALGARLNNKQAGTFGKIGCFSFHPRKAITTGEGGVAITDDNELANKIRALRNHGVNPENSAEFILPGFNYRMTEFQAAMGLTQMKKLDRIIESRRQAAEVYDKYFTGSKVISPLKSESFFSVYQSYIALLPENISRDNVINLLKNDGVETTIGTIHIPMTHYYRAKYKCKAGDFPVADDINRRALTLPLFEGISPAEQAEVVEKLLKCLG